MTSIVDKRWFLFTYHGLGHANVAWLKWNRHFKKHQRMDVSENSGTPKSSILIGFSIINYKPSILGYPYCWKHPNQRNQTGHDFDRSKAVDLPIFYRCSSSGRVETRGCFFSLRLHLCVFLVGGFAPSHEWKNMNKSNWIISPKKDRIEKGKMFEVSPNQVFHALKKIPVTAWRCTKL